MKPFIELADAASQLKLTTLIAPGKNNPVEKMEKPAGWVASVNSRIPLHITWFFHRYRMRDRGRPDASQIYRLADIAQGYLRRVYRGNC